jgi:hypothetical protein
MASFGQNTPKLPNYIFKSNSTKTNEDTTDLFEKIFLVYWSHEGRKAIQITVQNRLLERLH